MRLPLVRVAVVAAASLFALQATAQNAGNPIQVALLRWYAANTAAQISSCHAQGIAFDGAHIWVGCPIANTVQEFNASDGTKINTVFLGTSVSPSFLVYDGANIWTSNTNGTLTEVNASTATVVRTVSVGSNPLGMTFDGTNIWVANSGSDSVSIVQATTGSVTTSATFTNCNVPYGAIFDGTHVWLSCHNDNTIAE
jgi:YVTN family beta-propeller protein